MRKFLMFAGFLLILPALAVFGSSGNSGLAADTKSLPVVGSLEKLKYLVSRMEEQNRYFIEDSDGAMFESLAPAPNAVSREASKGTGQAEQFSETNVQVEGVDEADIVKTDGKYIYQVNNGRVIISKAHPPGSMKVQKVIHFNEGNYCPVELYVDNSYLVVIGTGSNMIYDYQYAPKPGIEIYPPPYHYKSYVKAVVFDIRDMQSIKKIRELELDGNYLSSRKLGTALYLVSNKFFDLYRIMEGEQPELPFYRDSAVGNKTINIGLDKIRYFPDCVSPNYLLVAGLDLSQPEKKADVTSYLGSGENIYVSQSAMYAAVSRFYNPRPLMPEYSSTSIYKFSLNAGNVFYKGAGKVPGTILNQFSMDAYKGCLRVATTTGDMWREDEGTSKNNVYVLDTGLKIIGKLENIAPGEKIYSARFMGGRAYLVTFKSVDPFFVIDMSSPKSPKILGALKIPGYSDYLHPVDNNHVLGFGKDTVEQKSVGWDGQETSFAYYQGMKVALFDVSDVTRPLEKYKIVIGDRGTDSPLLRNHKALLFDREKNLLAFPVTVMEVKGGNTNVTAYGEFVFQGALVYSFNIEEGFSLSGKITHLSDEDMLKSGYGWYESEKNVERVLYINETLYTISNSRIKANEIDTLVQIGELQLP